MDQEPVDSVTFSVYPDLSTIKRLTRRNSTGKANIRTSPSLLPSEQKHLPHYLRASTGSCHDFCKYGRKHAFEAMERQPIHLRFLGNKKIMDNELDQVQVPTLGKGRRQVKRPNPTYQLKTEEFNQSSAVRKKGLLTAKEFQAYGNGAEALSEESTSATTKTPLSPQNSISSNEHGYSDQAEGSFGELISMGVQKNIVTSELTVNYQTEGFFEKPIGVEVVNIEGFTGELVDMEEKELPALDGSIRDSTSNKQEEGSDGMSVLECAVLFDEISIYQSEDKSNEPADEDNASAGHTPGTQLVKSSEGSVNMMLKTSSSIKKKIDASSQKKFSEKKQKKKGKGSNASESRKRELTKLRSTLKSDCEMSVKSNLVTQKENDGPGKLIVSKQKASSPVKRTSMTVPLKMIEQRNSSSVEKSTLSGTVRILKLNTPSPSKKTNVSARSSNLAKPKTRVAKSMSPSTPSSGITDSGNKLNKVSRSLELPKSGEMFLKPPKASLSPRSMVVMISSMKLGRNGNKKLASPLKNGKKEVGYNGREHRSTSDPPHRKAENKDSKPMSSQINEPNFESEDAGSQTQVSSQKSDGKMKLRIVSIHHEVKAEAPHKLKFRRGNVVDPQSESSGPRRLQFRRASTMTETQTSKEKCVGSNVKQQNNMENTDSKGIIPEAPTVVLRHQDQQEKRDTQGLLNHVIEETASKLVESRKSKVKALVGAFETVISLHESGKVAPTV